MRTILAHESSRTKISISEAEADDLRLVGLDLASKTSWWGEANEDEEATSTRSILSLSRKVTDDDWELSTSQVVGVLQLPTLQLIILPKIPESHLWHFLREAWDLPRNQDKRTSLGDGSSMVEFLFIWYAKELELLLLAGLLRDYSEQEDELNAPRGSILVEQSIRSYYSGGHALTCRFDSFEIDTPINRIVKAAAEAVLASTLLPLDHRNRLRQSLAQLDGVGPLLDSDFRFVLERRSLHYRTSLRLAVMILASTFSTLSAGRVPAWAFVLPTPIIVERAIRSLLQRELSQTVLVRSGRKVLQEAGLTINPDLVFGLSTATGDIKYKIQGREWARSDLYQAIAFASGYDARFGMVVTMDRDRLGTLPMVHFSDTTIVNVAYPCHPETPPHQAQEMFLAEVIRSLDLRRSLQQIGRE